MTTIAIEPDYVASTGSATTTATSGSSNFWDYLALGTSAAGPVVEASYAAAGNEGAASIAAATYSSTLSSALAASDSASSSQYLTTGGSSASSAAYYTGGGSYSTGTDYSSSDVESILAETATSQAYLIGIQAQMGQMQSTFTALSNAVNVKTSMEREAIRNFKA